MTQVFPINSATKQPDANAPKAPDNQLGQDTFLKLLVAQLKYQDPLSPTDSSQFLTQTAQFTELETLQKISKQQDDIAKSSQMLAAATMVGRSVTYSLSASGKPAAPTGTSIVAVRGTLPKDAAVGTKATTETSVYTKTGQKIPLTLQFTKTATSWDVQAFSSGKAVGSPLNLGFDSAGDHTNNNLSLPSSALDAIAGTTGGWPAGGITLAFGNTNDPTRLQLSSGPATVAVAEQNGNDGNTATGVVTGIHMTADGPKLIIGGQDIPLTSVSDVES